MIVMTMDYGDDDHGYAEPRPLHSCCNCGVDPGKPHVNAHSVIPGDEKKSERKLLLIAKNVPGSGILNYFISTLFSNVGIMVVLYKHCI